MSIPRPSKHRSARLRKKLHMEEFQVFGFHAEFELVKGVTEAQFDQVFDAFIDQVEAQGLSCGGGGGFDSDKATCGFYVTRHQPTKNASHFMLANATEEDASQLHAWMSTEPLIEKYSVSDLTDAWWGPEESAA